MKLQTGEVPILTSILCPSLALITHSLFRSIPSLPLSILPLSLTISLFVCLTLWQACSLCTSLTEVIQEFGES